jgi:hypothetical protein
MNTRVPKFLSPKIFNNGEGEEREEILLELSNRSLEQALSLDLSTNQWSERGEDESPFFT